jgi:hypothetical protein
MSVKKNSYNHDITFSNCSDWNIEHNIDICDDCKNSNWTILHKLDISQDEIRSERLFKSHAKWIAVKYNPSTDQYVDWKPII